MSGKSKPIGAVVITHNSAGFVAACLESALKCASPVVVVDNASTDDTCAVVSRFPSVRLLANRHNAGFAAAANQGFAALENELVLLLNPDAILRSTIQPLEDACRAGAACAAGSLIDTEGKPQAGFMLRRFPTPATLCFEALGLNRLWPSNPVNRRYRCLDVDTGLAQDAEQPAGAFLLIRREVWRELGGFDETFHPLWFEDVDFLLRLRQKGHRTRFLPQVEVLHYGAHSLAGMPGSKRVWYWYANLLHYAAKHFHWFTFREVALAVALGCAFRIPAEMLRSRGFKPLFDYGKVIWLAGKALLVGPSSCNGISKKHAVPGANTSGTELTNSHSHGS